MAENAAAVNGADRIPTHGGLETAMPDRWLDKIPRNLPRRP